VFVGCITARCRDDIKVVAATAAAADTEVVARQPPVFRRSQQ